MSETPTHLHLDCFSGIAGDMFLGALIDLGVSPATVDRVLKSLSLSDWSINWHRRDAGHGMHGIGVEVLPPATPRLETVEEHQGGESGGGKESHFDTGHRTYQDIASLIERSDLGEGVKTRARNVFEKIALGEARVHGCSVQAVHFHELSGVDSIVDIVGAAAGLEELGIQSLSASPLPLGHGFTDSLHGRIPLPAPATLECLIGVPCHDSGLTTELVTPTGAGLIAALVTEFTPFPRMRIAKVGYGAGTRRHPDRPNLLRVVLGWREAEDALQAGEVWEVSANIDDQNPQDLAAAVDQLWEMEPLDVWLTGLIMKKGRPGQCLSVLCQPFQREAIAQALLRHTSTIGVRMNPRLRRTLERKLVQVQTPYGPIACKVAYGPDGSIWNLAPEADDCVRVAREQEIPTKVVRQVAVSSAMRQLVTADSED